MGRLSIPALTVHCPSCFAVPGEQCTTANGETRVTHTARRRLAHADRECPTCGVGRQQPCIKESGRVKQDIHAARVPRGPQWQETPPTVRVNPSGAQGEEDNGSVPHERR